MALYAIGDLHLSFQVECPVDMTQMGPEWVDHVDKIKRNFFSELSDDDTLVLVGDHSWGKKLVNTEKDLEFIASLPGRKILTRGNHDLFWQVKKTEQLNRLYEGRLEFLQNNFCTYGDYALIGSKGYCFENKDSYEHALMLVGREVERLEGSFKKARAEGFSKFIMFVHYPPTNILQKTSAFTRLAEREGVEHVVYAHCHGHRRFNDSLKGTVNGITYHLTSGDYLNWHPKKILD
ncbi:MAG: metallophosphoesterase [Clostridia bacterium]|nr:metallophosphoesterase [Clostridia bacterium]